MQLGSVHTLWGRVAGTGRRYMHRMYTRDHTWVEPHGPHVRVGMTAYGLRALGDVMHVSYDRALVQRRTSGSGDNFERAQSNSETFDKALDSGSSFNMNIHTTLDEGAHATGRVCSGDAVGAVESAKGAADICVPVGGRVVAFNEEALQSPARAFARVFGQKAKSSHSQPDKMASSIGNLNELTVKHDCSLNETPNIVENKCATSETDQCASNEGPWLVEIAPDTINTQLLTAKEYLAYCEGESA